MIPTTSPCVGADVAQDSIAFCGPTAATINNTPAALRTYLGTLPAGTSSAKPLAGIITGCTKPARRRAGP